MTEQAMAKLSGLRLRRIYTDLAAAHRAALDGAPAPVLTSGSCLPDYLLLDLMFTGDEKPIEALASEGISATSPSPQTGLREAYASIPTRNLAALVALPNVQRVLEPDLGRTSLNYTSEDIQANALRFFRRRVVLRSVGTCSARRNTAVSAHEGARAVTRWRKAC